MDRIEDEGCPPAKNAWWERLWKEYLYCPEDEATVIIIVMVVYGVWGMLCVVAV